MVAVFASEIVAGALQDLDRAVVGSRFEKDWYNDRLICLGTQLKVTIFAITRHPEDAFKHWITLKKEK
jgi:hypothetical protein